MNTELIAKIQKLLMLANSANEHEARLASSKAQELLLKHNLDMQQIEGHQAEYDKEIVDLGKRRPPEAKWIAPLIEDYFMVNILFSHRGARSSVIILGEKTNLEVASYTFMFLSRSFKELWSVRRRQFGQSGQSSFYAGLNKGLRSQLEETRKRVTQERGLVLVKDPGLMRFTLDQYPRTRFESRRAILRNGQAFSVGEAEGRRLNIRRGLGGEAVRGGLSLPGSVVKK